jgi:hypothetical protein
VLHETYLPFTEDQLRLHFAAVAGDPRADPDRHVAYYRQSLNRLRDLDRGSRAADARTVKRARQIEKDERFWVVAALMALFHGGRRQSAFASLLDRAGLGAPGDFTEWTAALRGELALFFEVGLNSPRVYREYLSRNLDERAPIPYVREAAGRAKLRLEGATQVDALLIAADTGVGVLFEAKVLSDCAAMVTYDVLRNQLARNIDVMLDRQSTLPFPLDQRDPALSSFVLLTPELFRDNPRSRLYGWLIDDYRSRPESLAEDLPHRSGDWSAVAQRIGWATFEDCRRVDADACKWLRRV